MRLPSSLAYQTLSSTGLTSMPYGQLSTFCPPFSHLWCDSASCRFFSGNHWMSFSTAPMKVSVIQRRNPPCGRPMSVNCSVFVSNFIRRFDIVTVNHTLSSWSVRIVWG